LPSLRNTLSHQRLTSACSKTGVDLKDTGERDEHGLQPMDGMFSDDTEEDDLTQGEEDMDIEHGSPPSLSAVRKPVSRQKLPAVSSSQLSRSSPPPPAQRKLFGGADGSTASSAAKSTPGRPVNRRAPELEEEEEEEEEEASPEPDGVDDDETREADEVEEESQEEEEESQEEEEEEEVVVQHPAAKAKSRPNAVPTPKPVRAPLANGSVNTPGRVRPSKAAAVEPEPESEEEEEEPEEEPEEGLEEVFEQELPLEPDQELETEPESEPESEPTPVPSSAKKRGRPAAPKASESDPRQNKRQKTTATPAAPRSKSASASAAAAVAAAKPGRQGRPRKAAAGGDDVGDESIMAVHRGPPMPKAAGLVSTQPDNGVFMTRSGRHSFRPLQYWRGEKVVLEDNTTIEDATLKGRKIVVPSIKSIVRIEEEAPPLKRRGRPAKRVTAAGASSSLGLARRPRPPRPDEDGVEQYEEWEVGAGTLSAPVIFWDESHQKNPPGPNDEVEVVEEQIAVSGPGLEPREIRDADFRFVKTLTTPFLGTGIVDLPPGAEKKSKNTRRMYMVFFVFQGKVEVTVHDSEFRISAGGTFFVPRGEWPSLLERCLLSCALLTRDLLPRQLLQPPQRLGPAGPLVLCAGQRVPGTQPQRHRHAVGSRRTGVCG
jgi:centromere protein C